MAMCLTALGLDTNEDEVNKVMGARPMQGATWEQAVACAQHYGKRAILTCPGTVAMLKTHTDMGHPVMIAWNPEGRDWSHASVVFDVDDEFVHVADPNMPNPDKTVRRVTHDEFYDKWTEKWPNYLVRRPMMAIIPEVTPDGRQVLASQTEGRTMVANQDPMDASLTKLTALYREAGGDDLMEDLKAVAGEMDPSDFDLSKTAASGMYGYTKKTERDCMAACRKVERKAKEIAKRIYRKDEDTAAFMKKHAERTGNVAASVLVEAMKSLGPKFASERTRRKQAKKGLYGFRSSTCNRCLKACVELRKAVGGITTDLHSRREGRHDRITNFLDNHAEEAGCKYARILRLYYPDAPDGKQASVPLTFREWLEADV